MTKPTVLVVDDEESMRYFLGRTLRKKGFDVVAVATGEEAITAVGERPSDVVLLDLKLPGMDGIEVLTEVKRLSPETVVILMTGYGTVERALEAMHRGASDFVTKPLDIEAVLGKIRDALERGAPAPAPSPLPAPVPRPPAPAGTPSSLPPPRPLVSFLIEAAEHRELEHERPEGGDLRYREASRLFDALYFLELLQRTGGNVSMAARISGVSRPNLHRKIQDLGIDVDRLRE